MKIGIMKLQKFLWSRKNSSSRPSSDSSGSSSLSSAGSGSFPSGQLSGKQSGKWRSPLSRSQSVEMFAESASSSRQNSGRLQAKCKLLPGQMRELEEVFRYIDRNGDGKISVSELAAVLQSLGDDSTEAEVRLMLQEVDVDGDGFISLEEFINVNAMAADVSGSVATADELKAAFCVFDIDKNGFISAEELYRVLSSLGEKGLTIEECTKMIRCFDCDGDGFVDFEEFRLMMSKPRSFMSN